MPPTEFPPRPGLSRNARYGLVLFVVYCVFYGGFVVLNAFAAAAMGRPVAWLGGLNFAVAYGVALIVVAFLLALVYMALCGPDEEGGPK